MKPDSASAGAHVTQDQIAEYLYGDAAPELAAHVAACPECREECDAVRRTLQLLQNWETPELAPDYENAVWQKLAVSLPPQKNSFRPRRPTVIWTAAAALAAMTVVAISLQFAGSRVQEPPDRAVSTDGDKLATDESNERPDDDRCTSRTHHPTPAEGDPDGTDGQHSRRDGVEPQAERS